jgi:DNA helicase II / ATP-dependent DNA helicase PcrA
MTEIPSHLQRLNPEQHRAVTTIDGPLLILAGAGSGKTRVLTRRIAQMIHTGLDPANLLAVTFTNKAAAEMKERVAELIGEAGKRVWVSTFHSSCCRILRKDIEALGYTRRFAIYDDDDQLRILRDFVKSYGYDKSKVDPRAIRGQIDHYKNRMLSIDDVLKQMRSHVNDPLIKIWRDYEEALRAADALDFNDLIGTTVRLFREHPDVLARWNGKFQYIMVDEYQDTNQGQYEFLQMLSASHRNLAVVGDDDQSIYGFRGADISNILNFEKDYPEATVVRLEQNYRSTGNILQLANAVVSENTGRLAKKLWTEAPTGPRVKLFRVQTPRDEARRVARTILQLRRAGHKWEDIAIIYRTNAISRQFEHALRAVKIPHRIVGGRKFYERREIRDVLSFLRLIVNPADDAAFLRVVNVPTRGIGAKTLAKLREEASSRGLPLLRTARAQAGGKSKTSLGFGAFVSLIDELAEAARECPPNELVQSLLERSGYRAMLQSDRNAKDQLTVDARSRLANLDELVLDASGFKAPPDTFSSLDRLTAWLDRIALSADSDDIPEDGEVTLMTVHSSKGLEYPVLFVVQMNEGIFPHSRSEDTGVEEERRLAYVAFTRAMKRLSISWTRQNVRLAQGRQHTSEAKPSRFLYGLPEEVIEGDQPLSEPAGSETAEPVKHTKFKAFLTHRQAPGPPPDTAHTLVDIEDASQLSRGVQIHHEQLGTGEIRHVKGSMVQVAFQRGGQRWVNLLGAPIHLIVE